MTEKPEPLTTKNWNSQEHLDGLVTIESVRGAYLWTVKEIESRIKERNDRIERTPIVSDAIYRMLMFDKYEISGLNEALELLKKAFQAVSGDVKS